MSHLKQLYNKAMESAQNLDDAIMSLAVDQPNEDTAAAWEEVGTKNLEWNNASREWAQAETEWKRVGEGTKKIRASGINIPGRDQLPSTVTEAERSAIQNKNSALVSTYKKAVECKKACEGIRKKITEGCVEAAEVYTALDRAWDAASALKNHASKRPEEGHADSYKLREAELRAELTAAILALAVYRHINTTRPDEQSITAREADVQRAARGEVTIEMASSIDAVIAHYIQGATAVLDANESDRTATPANRDVTYLDDTAAPRNTEKQEKSHNDRSENLAYYLRVTVDATNTLTHHLSMLAQTNGGQAELDSLNAVVNDLRVEGQRVAKANAALTEDERSREDVKELQQGYEAISKTAMRAEHEVGSSTTRPEDQQSDSAGESYQDPRTTKRTDGFAEITTDLEIGKDRTQLENQFRTCAEKQLSLQEKIAAEHRNGGPANGDLITQLEQEGKTGRRLANMLDNTGGTRYAQARDVEASGGVNEPQAQAHIIYARQAKRQKTTPHGAASHTGPSA